MKNLHSALLAACLLTHNFNANAQNMTPTTMEQDSRYTDQELVKKLPGFTNRSAVVNGIKLHYVIGGKGKPLVCLPGWPQTWWSYHSIATQLAEKFQVIIIDIRGMGSSDKPLVGYDKKTMASDIRELTKQLKLDKIYLMGHDIGAMVACSFAANYPQSVDRLVLLDGSHPNEGMMKMPMLPAPGTFGNKMDGKFPYAWWFSFNQVRDLPEKLLAGRMQYLLDWLYNYVMIDDRKMSDFDRGVFADAYNQPDNIRAGNGWYQSLTKDAQDGKNYSPLTMPVLGIASYIGVGAMKMGLPQQVKNPQMAELNESGHFIFEEQPDKVLKLLTDFLR